MLTSRNLQIEANISEDSLLIELSLKSVALNDDLHECQVNLDRAD